MKDRGACRATVYVVKKSWIHLATEHNNSKTFTQREAKDSFVLSTRRGYGTSPESQRVRVQTSTEGGTGSIPGQEAKILQAAWHGQIQTKKMGVLSK